jgi:hypothetical protein
VNLATIKYIKEHKKIFSLKKKIYFNPEINRDKQPISWSINKLIFRNIKSVLSCIKNYPFQVIKYFKYLKTTYKLRNKKNNKNALVLGNGPSQGYLTDKELIKFQNEGNETICVNNLSKSYKGHVPNWLVLSDPLTFKNKLYSKKLLGFIKKNSSINIFIPTTMIDELKKLNIKNKLYTFIDLELTCSKNINPLLPRGYCSMTLYKALAISIFFGYKNIGIIGMDNTYPRQIYNDKNNKIIKFETSFTLKERVDIYPHDTVASILDTYIQLFTHLSYFPKKNIFNLDPYSLTDRFKKIKKQKFLINLNDKKKINNYQ